MTRKPRPRKPRKRRLPVVLTPAEAEALRVAARTAVNEARTPRHQWLAWRDFAMIETGLLAGPRVAELCALQIKDVDLGGAVLSIIGGKGDKDRNVPIGNKLLRVLGEWIGDRTEGWLFPGPNSRRLSERTFRERLEALCHAAGIPRRKAHPHTLRHTFATTLHREKVSVRTIQELLGHASIATTQIYLFVDTSEMKGAVDRL